VITRRPHRGVPAVVLPGGSDWRMKAGCVIILSYGLNQQAPVETSIGAHVDTVAVNQHVALCQSIMALCRLHKTLQAEGRNEALSDTRAKLPRVHAAEPKAKRAAHNITTETKQHSPGRRWKRS
jgi:hypothetical protein